MVTVRLMCAGTAVVSAVALTGCSEPAKAAPAAAVRPIGQLPAHVLGYRTQAEDVRKQLRRVGKDAYVTGIKLWTLREGSYLRAAVEVARFAADAPVDTESFRADVASQVAESAPLLRHVGGSEVYVTTGPREVFYVWFHGRDMLLLTVPETTPQPRRLLRVLLRTARP